MYRIRNVKLESSIRVGSEMFASRAHGVWSSTWMAARGSGGEPRCSANQIAEQRTVTARIAYQQGLCKQFGQFPCECRERNVHRVSWSGISFIIFLC